MTNPGNASGSKPLPPPPPPPPAPPVPPSQKTGERLRELHDMKNKTAEQILDEQ